MLSKVGYDHLKLGKFMEVVRIVSIQYAKGASMVCSQCLVSDYWCGWKFNHGEVFSCIHGIQIHANYRNLRAVLNWMAMFFADGTRWDLSRFSGSFHIFSPGPFWVGWCRCRCVGWFLRARWRMIFDCNGLHGG